ncbi:MAG: hypothetical protein GXP54_10805 [Deltaproteobacteria bacterium]|nr:hypothetical protein [Deltaproteobacteria bacterium]
MPPEIGRTAARLLVGLALLSGCTGGKGGSGPDTGPILVTGTFGQQFGAELRYPVRIAAAQDGTIYVSDVESDSVLGYKDGRRVFELNGMERPLAVAVRGSRLYVGSQGRGSVEIYDIPGKSFQGVLGSGQGVFAMPNDIALAADGTVYVADSRRDVVEVFGPDGARTATISGRDDGEGRLRFPAAVAVDDENLFVADQGHHRIQVFDRSNRWVRDIGGPIPAQASNVVDFAGRFTRIQGIAIHGKRLYVLDSYHAHVQVLDRNGQGLGFVGRRGDCADCLSLGTGLVLGMNGKLLVTDPEHHRWITLDPDKEDTP